MRSTKKILSLFVSWEASPQTPGLAALEVPRTASTAVAPGAPAERHLDRCPVWLRMMSSSGFFVFFARVRKMELTRLQTFLTYGIYYSFFEVFPLVYPPIYHFDIGEVGLCFLTIGIACLLGVTGCLMYQFWYLIPDIKKNGLRAPEHRLVPALLGVISLPVGYFMFG